MLQARSFLAFMQRSVHEDSVAAAASEAGLQLCQLAPEASAAASAAGFMGGALRLLTFRHLDKH